MFFRLEEVPIRNKSYMFGDNKSVVDSSMQLHAKLHKRHTMLSFHCVREAIASGIVGFFYVPRDINPADILRKHWGYSQIRERLKSLLFWKGDTADVIVEKHLRLQGSDNILSKITGEMLFFYFKST
jgi:hypothetical protein